MRPFQIGDRVKIADTMGDVVEKTLLVTRIRTAKNVEVTVPTASFLALISSTTAPSPQAKA
ncbi:mechanosensitive ion channel domain-containing protein [Leptonema illini]|uniref:mechanosensitive ion channel domain-containing protein n=1 Tax=Leptonema illini TaxID=183 RepID=UPI0003059733|nr:mechanosensitive ion channel domain-containing protein [Leptonema illini]